MLSFNLRNKNRRTERRPEFWSVDWFCEYSANASDIWLDFSFDFEFSSEQDFLRS